MNRRHDDPFTARFLREQPPELKRIPWASEEEPEIKFDWQAILDLCLLLAALYAILWIAVY